MAEKGGEEEVMVKEAKKKKEWVLPVDPIPVQILPEFDWKTNDSASACTNCGDKFSLFLRKRHCRVCGEVFCPGCVIVQGLSGGELHRCCEKCLMKSWKKYLKDAKKKEKQKMSMKQQNVEGQQAKKKDSTFQGQQQMMLMQQRQGLASEQLTQIADSNPEGQRRVLPAMSEVVAKKMEDWQSFTVPITVLPEFEWVAAEDQPTCADCDLKVWDASRARHHHCRCCGEVFCDECSPLLGFEANSDSRSAELRCCRFCVADYFVKEEQETQAREVRLKGVASELAKAKIDDGSKAGIYS